jgi:membrane protease subunit HflC
MSVSIVPETKQAIISSYGQPLRVVNPYKPNQQFGDTWAGLTFRIPFVEQIQWVDKRVLSVSMQPQEVQSTDRRRLRVDAFARFRIVKPARCIRLSGPKRH